MSAAEYQSADSSALSHGHGPGGLHQHGSRASSRRSLAIALSLTVSYLVAELIGGLMAHSLSLVADAAHMVTDAAAMGLALLAMWAARRPASINRTFGFYRTEILAALLNALGLWLITAWINFNLASFISFVPPNYCLYGKFRINTLIGILYGNLQTAASLVGARLTSFQVNSALPTNRWPANIGFYSTKGAPP